MHVIGQLITLISIVSQFASLSDLENSLKFKREAIKSLEILLHRKKKNCVTNCVYAKEEEEVEKMYTARE